MAQGSFEQHLAKLFVYRGIFLDPDVPRGWKLRLGPEGTAGAPTGSGKELFSLEGSHAPLGSFPNTRGWRGAPGVTGVFTQRTP